MTLSLRGRLLIGVISLVVIGLLVSDVATYVTLRNSLLSRIDQQLTARSTVDTAVAVIANQCRARGPGTASDFPAGTIAELIGVDGTPLTSCGFQLGGAVSGASPELPKSLPNAGLDSPAPPFTVEGTGGVAQYRITAWSENSFSGQFVVFAIPLTVSYTHLRAHETRHDLV